MFWARNGAEFKQKDSRLGPANGPAVFTLTNSTLTNNTLTSSTLANSTLADDALADADRLIVYAAMSAGKHPGRGSALNETIQLFD